MIDTHCKQFYEKYIIHPILKREWTKKITPLQITLLAFLSGMSTLPFIIYDCKTWAVFMLTLSGFLDSLDGSMARYQNRCSSRGAIWDVFCDRVVECSVVIGLFCVAPQERALSCILMLSSILLCITSFLVVGIFTQNETKKSFHYSPGLMERAEGLLFFVFMILFPKSFVNLSYLFTALVLWTALRRTFQFSGQHAQIK